MALQRLEVRAYGCLLEELLERCNAFGGLGGLDTLDAPPHVAAQLAALKTRCLSEDIDSRPLFAEIAANVASLDRHVREGVKP
jgi:hypothetical protein